MKYLAREVPKEIFAFHRNLHFLSVNYVASDKGLSRSLFFESTFRWEEFVEAHRRQRYELDFIRTESPQVDVERVGEATTIVARLFFSLNGIHE